MKIECDYNEGKIHAIMRPENCEESAVLRALYKVALTAICGSDTPPCSADGSTYMEVRFAIESVKGRQ